MTKQQLFYLLINQQFGFDGFHAVLSEDRSCSYSCPAAVKEGNSGTSGGQC